MVRLHPEIAAVAQRFVRVRLTRIDGVDLRRFEFDYDVTWYAFFLNADETIYGRYGGRDARDSEGRLSYKGLRYALERAWEAHQRPPVPQPLPGRPLRAGDFQAAQRHKGCIHCHNINEFRRADEQVAGTWDRTSIWVYPLPENIGLMLDNDQGDLVRRVLPDSAAARAGLRPGDRLVRLNGYSVASFADASYALHKAPWQGTIPLLWQRDGRTLSAQLKLQPGWRKTNLTWRPSMLDLLPAVPFNGEDLTDSHKRELGLSPHQAAFRQTEPVHPDLVRAGIRVGDIVIGVDGTQCNGAMSDLLGHIRRNYLVGDTITVNIVRDGRRVDIRLTLK